MNRQQILFLDELFRKAIRKRDGKRCRYCLYHKGTEVHHLFTRRKQSVRWDMLNGILLCPRCHRYAESHRKSFREEVLSKKDLEKLELKANTPAKLDFEEVEKYLKGFL